MKIIEKYEFKDGKFIFTRTVSEFTDYELEVLGKLYKNQGLSAYADEFVSIEEKTDGKIIHVAGRHVQHQKIACLYNEKTKYFFQEIVDESEIQKIFKNTTKVYGRSRDYLKKNYPELYEYIANEENPRTTIAICKVFPNETKDTLRDNGFWYSGKNLDIIKKGAKTESWYVRDVLK